MDEFEERDIPLCEAELATLPQVYGSDQEEDYQKSRDNLYDLLEKGKDALNVALAMVEATESPRAIEVFSTLLKTLADTNLQLLDVQKKRKDIFTESSGEGDVIKNQTINQTAIFAGTTAELLKAINSMNPGQVIEHE